MKETGSVDKIKEILDLFPVVLKFARVGLKFVKAEQARTGKTADEILADADVTLDANEKRLLEKIAEAERQTAEHPA
jgi:hypothetical protein